MPRWHFTGTALVLHWLCTGTALISWRYCAGATLALALILQGGLAISRVDGMADQLGVPPTRTQTQTQTSATRSLAHRKVFQRQPPLCSVARDRGA